MIDMWWEQLEWLEPIKNKHNEIIIPVKSIVFTIFCAGTINNTLAVDMLF